MKKLPPFVFEPVYQDYIWGGSRIAKKFHRTKIPARCAESWEIADRPEGMSRINEGPMQGRTLHELVEEFGENLLGRGRSDKAFPLLVKIIDAKEPLSIQVHPSEETAKICKGEPKTEMWYVLHEGPVYAAFKKPVRPEEFSRAIRENTVADLIQKIQVKPGDAVFIPGGRVHAIGAGCMMLEVQQNSNTTYRVYDWNRVGSDGQSRPLHIEQAQQCIKWDDDNDPLVAPELIADDGFSRRWRVLSSLFFTIERWEIVTPYRVDADPKTFQIFFHLLGAEKGKTVLLPAHGESCELPAGSTVLRITI
jgi:mannose-6-phosphate isomerase